MSDPLDDLIRASLAATTDSERAEISAKISRVPDVVAQLTARIRSTEWETRRLAMHFVSRLAPPPEELTPAIISVLWSPLSRDPFGEETVVGLVIAGVVATRLVQHRWPIEQRLEWIERAMALGRDEPRDHPGEPTHYEIEVEARAEIVLRLAKDTMAKLDAATAIERAKYDAMVGRIAARFATEPGEAIAMVALQSATVDDDRYAWSSGVWQSIAETFARSSPKHREALEHSLDALRGYASGSSSGAEGTARMADVHALERVIASLPTT